MERAKGDIIIGREREDRRIIHRTSGKAPSNVESSWHANEVREVAKTEIVGGLFQNVTISIQWDLFPQRCGLGLCRTLKGRPLNPDRTLKIKRRRESRSNPLRSTLYAAPDFSRRQRLFMECRPSRRRRLHIEAFYERRRLPVDSRQIIGLGNEHACVL